MRRRPGSRGEKGTRGREESEINRGVLPPGGPMADLSGKS